MDFLGKLNDPQREAVLHGEGPLLVLAGAGSGKTRVLTHRIARLIYEGHAGPDNVFAVTFTNKAAAEMRHRVEQLLLADPRFHGFGRDLWVTTFHSACVRILRSDVHHLGYANQFSIYDDSDQISTIKACMKELNVSDTMISPKSVQGRINRAKNDGLDHESWQPTFGGPAEDAFHRLFVRYAEALKLSSALDFGDLISLSVKLFDKHPQVLEKYRRRFRYVMVDEYQDTNKCQYLLMKHLAGPRGNVCAVGDEDQSIYKWRGADITNILNFERDFPNAHTVKLEQNYRSTRTIIQAASRVIAYNTARRDKELWTENDQGDRITVFEGYDEHDEAQKVMREVQKCLGEGAALEDIAIFYRTNAQSRLLEDNLRSRQIPYLIFGGLKFYDRLEVKDALAYLRLLVNCDDDAGFRRVVNVPGRGIGAVALEKLTARARMSGLSLYATLSSYFGSTPQFPVEELGRAAKAYAGFFRLMEGMREAKARLLPSDMLNVVLEETGYRRSLSDEATEESRSRLENLAELRQSIVEYELRSGSENPERSLSLENFLEEVALVADIEKINDQSSALKMMTVHMAKGLEFDHVCIVGLEDELFPNVRPWQPGDDGDVEEERRLFYVAMTRARKSLRLFYAKNRTVFGTSSFRTMSQFIDEIPEEFVDAHKAEYFERRNRFVDRPSLPRRLFQDPGPGEFESSFQEAYADDVSQLPADETIPKVGAHVLHPTFGEGVVRRYLGDDKLMVEFQGRGVKKISLRFVELKPR